MKPGLYRTVAAALLLALGGAGRLAAAEGDAELVKFADEILQWDVNLNGWLDDAEMTEAASRYPQMVLTRFLDTLRQTADTNGDGRISAEERKAVLTQAGQTDAVWRRTFANYDNDHDGRLSRQEALNVRRLSNYSYSDSSEPNDIFRRLFGVQFNGSEIPDTIGKEVDRDDNGFLDPAEILAAGPLLQRQFDADGDGVLNSAELLACSEEAYFQDALYRLCPEADKDNDGWLSAAEMAAALAPVLPLYDIDKNGSLDAVERAMAIRDGQCAWPREALVYRLSRDQGAGVSSSSSSGRESQILANAAVKYGGPGATRFGPPEIFKWRRQFETAQILSIQDLATDWLRSRLEMQMNPAWGGEVRAALWKKRFALYDANQDGQLDALECCRLLQKEFIPGSASISNSYSSSEAPAWIAFADAVSGGRRDSMSQEDRQALLPLLFMRIDADGDGIFSPADAQALKPVLEEKQREKTAREAMLTSLRAGRPNLDLPAAEFKAEMDKLKQRFDLDHDGKFNREELRALLAQVEAETRDRVVATWLTKLGRFADADADGQLNAKENILATAMMRFCYDRNGSGAFEKAEVTQMQSDLQQQEYYDRERQQRMERDRAMLRRYDLDGDGKISPADRARAEADRRRNQESGLTAPPQDD